MKEYLRHEDLELLSLSQLVVTQMLGDLTADQLDRAKDIFAERIFKGEGDLRSLYRYFRHAYLKDNEPELKAFTNSFDYLQFLYTNRPKFIADQLKKLEGREASLVSIYEEEINSQNKHSKIKRLGGLAHWLYNRELYIEAAYPKKSGPNNPAALIVVRRKDTKRAIQKLAQRLLEYEIARDDQNQNNHGKNNSNKNNQQKGNPAKRVSIEDWFGIKLVAYSQKQAFDLANRLYAELGRVNFQLADTREPRIEKKTGNRLKGEQPAGIDNHYLFGKGKDHLIQITVRNVFDEYSDGQSGAHLFKEITITDTVNFLVDEMDHTRFEQSRVDELSRLLSQRRSYKKRYDHFVARGEELEERLSKDRRMILLPTETFCK